MNSPYWFEIAIICGLTTIGGILMGHWESGTPKWRRILKIFVFCGLSVLISATAGRAWFFVFLGVMTGLAILIHAWWLPKKGHQRLDRRAEGKVLRAARLESQAAGGGLIHLPHRTMSWAWFFSR